MPRRTKTPQTTLEEDLELQREERAAPQGDVADAEEELKTQRKLLAQEWKACSAQVSVVRDALDSGDVLEASTRAIQCLARVRRRMRKIARLVGE